MRKPDQGGSTADRAGVTRRDVLKALAATGAMAGAAPLLSTTGCASTAPSDPVVESRDLYFDFSHLRPDEHDFVLHAGSHRVELSRSTTESFAEARRSNTFIDLLAASKVTHHVKGLELSARHLLACHVKMYPRGSRASWKFALMFWHHPAKAIRDAHARLSPALRHTLSIKSKRAGLLGSSESIDPVAEAAYHDSSSQAAFMASCHPELLSADPTSNSHVSQAYLSRNNPGVGDLSDFLSQNPDGWCDLQLITDPNGIPYLDTTGNVIQLPQPTATANDMLASAIGTGLSGAKSDKSLGWYSSSGRAPPAGAIWIADDGTTHDDQSPSTVAVSARGARLRRAKASRRGLVGAGEPELHFPALGSHKGYKVTANGSETDASGNHYVEVSFNNSYCRHLGLYVRYLDGAHKPILLSTVQPFLTANAKLFIDPPSAPTTKYDIGIGMLGPEFEILGIPTASGKAEATIPVPSVATSFQVIAQGIGTGTNTYPGLTLGQTLTAVLDLSVPMLFLATAATAEFSGWCTEENKDNKIMAECVEMFLEVLAPFIDLAYDQNDANSWGELAKTICAKLLEEFSKNLEETAEFVLSLLGFIAAGEATDAVPLVGQIIFAITAAATTAQLTQTVAEISCSPCNYPTTGDYTHGITVTLKPDTDDPKGFPAVATHYTVSAICKRLDASGNVVDQASPVTYTGQMGATQVTDPIVVDMDVPYGGSIEVTVAFYSADGWLAGQGTTGIQDNTGDTFAITIKENLVPITPTTVYSHKEKTAIDGSGNHYLVGTTTPPRNTANCVDQAGAVCSIVNLTNLNTSPGGVGYAWESYNDPQKYHRCGPAGGSGQLYGFANIGVTSRPQAGYLASSCGLMAPVRIAYALTGSNVMNFYLDDKNYVRQIRLTGNTPSYDGPLSNLAWGKLNCASDAFFVTKAGKVVSVNRGASKIESLQLTSAVADAQAPLATMASGPGVRPGLMSGPVCAGLMNDDTLLILEAGANQVQAFDSAGNPVKKYPGQANPYAFPLSRYPATDTTGTVRFYTDMAIEYTGFIYLLSYPKDNPALQSLDIYDPDGNWVCRTLDVPGAKFTVSLWRDLYAGNYEALHNPVTGVYEPSISHWIPSTP